MVFNNWVLIFIALRVMVKYISSIAVRVMDIKTLNNFIKFNRKEENGQVNPTQPSQEVKFLFALDFRHHEASLKSSYLHLHDNQFTYN